MISANRYQEILLSVLSGSVIPVPTNRDEAVLIAFLKEYSGGGGGTGTVTTGVQSVSVNGVRVIADSNKNVNLVADTVATANSKNLITSGAVASHTNNEDIHITLEEKAVIRNLLHNKGFFTSEAELNATYPIGQVGDYATTLVEIVTENGTAIGKDLHMFIWDDTQGKWLDTNISGMVTSVNGKTGDVELADLPYDNTVSGLTATTFKNALDEIVVLIKTLPNNSNILGSYADYSYLPAGVEGDLAYCRNDYGNCLTGWYLYTNGFWERQEDTNLVTKIAELNNRSVIGEELDSCYLGLGNDITPVLDNPIQFTKISGNIECTNGKLQFKAGKRYAINVGISFVENDGSIGFKLYDYTNDVVLMLVDKNTTNLNQGSVECQYTASNDCEIGLYAYTFRKENSSMHSQSYITVEEIGRTYIQHPAQITDDEYGLEDTPVGHIISYMGNVAPKHYLICDGAIYNIADYPKLATHINDEFGSYSYFGGDGIATFAVPDLRGEFLRGSGTATRSTGSGANVGEHQDGTAMPKIGIDEYKQVFVHTEKTPVVCINPDLEIIDETHKTGMSIVNDNYETWDGSGITHTTTRPTNTSVLYCIKCEPTYYMVHTTGDGTSAEAHMTDAEIDILISNVLGSTSGSSTTDVEPPMTDAEIDDLVSDVLG